ncbi:MAG: type II toxin-antitoxin system prevent-host-death family antitoxin [Acidimicrobiales bacterium]|nr:type II toxin-antitoxin system prevent-host-death family antitoxin [Acidimicrobiales bacterium]
MEIGVRELKARLSEYLGKVEAGESVVVTDRGRPVARLVPFAAESAIERGIDEGWIEAPRRTGLAAAQRHRSPMGALEVLDEDRG